MLAPSFVVFNSQLYLSWMEVGSSGNNGIRMAAYNGNDVTPAWLSVSGSAGVNFNSGYEARNPRAISFNGKLYLSWEEWDSGTSEQIRVAVFNGNNSSPKWTFVDGGATPIVNWNKADKSQGPQLIVFNSQLVSVWREEVSGIGHVRAKIYGGDDTNPTWTSIDGGGTLGLNFNPSSDILYSWNHGPTLSLFNSKIYSIWAENDLIYVKVGVLP